MGHPNPLSSKYRDKPPRRRFLQVSAAGVTFCIGAGQVGAADMDSNSDDVNEIEDWHDLNDIRHKLDGDHILIADLDETTPGYEEYVATPENGWNPIGDAGGFLISPDDDVDVLPDPFTGTFDGNGYEIANLRINRPEASHFGLFAGIEGTISDVTLVDVEINGKSCGSLIGLNGGGQVIQSSASGSVTGDSVVGGLVEGNILGEVRGSSADVRTDGETTVGGLVGNNIGGEISDSSASGEVHGEEAVGGLSGKNSGERADAIISDSSANGSVDGFREVGGLVGINEGGSIEGSSTNGIVTGERIVGGLVGKNEGIVATSEATGQVDGLESAGPDARNGRVGGLIGYHMSGEVNKSSASADVSGFASVGGFIGRNGGTVINSWSTGDVTGNHAFGGGIGGLIGSKDSGKVRESWSSSNVDDSHFPDSGGLVASADTCDVADSYWNSSINDPSEGSNCTGASGLPTADMEGESAAEMMSALDFEETWVIQTDPADYPVLAWQRDDSGEVDSSEGTDEETDEDDSGNETRDEGGESDEESTQINDTDEDDTDEAVPGFGVGATLGGIGSVLYVLKQRLDINGPEQQ